MSLTDDNAWWQKFGDTDNYRKFLTRPIAYFCAEFGLSSNLSLYAGGLGILAGDVIREAADRHFPMVGVGLYYHGDCEKHPGSVTKGLTPAADRFSRRVTIKVPLRDNHILVQAVKFEERSIPVYLLTTDVDGNSLADREITANLYPSNKEKRLQQEIILGIGGLRLLEALQIHPAIYHLNEGHSSLLALEIAAHETRERGIGFADGLELAKNRIVFTNHTLVPAGNDIFSNDMVAANLSKFAEELTIPVGDLVKLGLVQDSSLFSMTMLSLRLARKINAVSQFHAKKAAETWTDHPMEGITNGIHFPSWNRMGKSQISNLNPFDKLRSSTPRSLRLEEIDAERSRSIKSQIWVMHQENKRILLSHIHHVAGQSWPEDALLLGWARRIVGYKQPLALFADLDRLKKICLNSSRPVRLVISGNVQEGDEEGQKLLEELKGLLDPALAVYLPNYNMDLAGLMTAGCDVWLNTPVVGFEACGTSGMKACLNGVLPLSTKDGWMAEIESYGIGWMLDSDRVSDSIYQILEDKIIPLYFDRKPDWMINMAQARQLILDRFTTTKLLKEYVEKLYLPLLEIV